MRRQKRQQRKNKPKQIKIILYFVLAVVLLLPFLYFKLTTKYWDGTNKVSILLHRGYRVGAKVDELKPHDDGAGGSCLKGRGVIIEVENEDRTGIILCEECHQTVKESI